jgi:hypothetical protein
MTKLRQFMVVHHNPGIDCNEVQANWRKLAKVEPATWMRTYFNEEKGMRYCIWLARSEEDLKDIFNELDVSYESITVVEETVPDLWGEKWDEHLEKEAVADTLGI